VSGGPPNLDAQRCNAGAASNDRPTVHSLNDPADRDLPAARGRVLHV